jgi:hypothetical protein
VLERNESNERRLPRIKDLHIQKRRNPPTGQKNQAEEKAKAEIMDGVVLPHSQKVYSSSLNLFDLPASKVGVNSSEFLQLFPQASVLDTTSPIIFHYQGTNQHYPDLSSPFLHIEA